MTLKISDELEREKENIALIDKKATVLFDGRQFMIKIPSDVAIHLRLKKGYKIHFIVDSRKGPDEEYRFKVLR